jgi:stage V sporulation protein SpoVS
MVIKPVSNQSVSEAASSELALSTQGASARNQAYRPWAIARIFVHSQIKCRNF